VVLAVAAAVTMNEASSLLHPSCSFLPQAGDEAGGAHNIYIYIYIYMYIYFSHIYKETVSFVDLSKRNSDADYICAQATMNFVCSFLPQSGEWREGSAT